MIRALAVLLGTAITTAHAEPMSDAFNQGAAFGRDGISTTRSKINRGSAESTIPHAITKPAEASYFSGTGLGAPATARLGACPPPTGTRTGTTDPACSAVDFSQTNAARRPSFTIVPTDPLLSRAEAITADPETIAGSITGTYSACTVQTVTRPDLFERATCHQYRTVEPVTCQKIRTVNVAWRSNCAPGTWFGDSRVITSENGDYGDRYACGIYVELGVA